MGRTQPTMSIPPAAFRKDARAKFAKTTLNKTIPDILKSNARARKGLEAAELIVDPQRCRPNVDSSPQPIVIHLQVSDTITAAIQLTKNARSDGGKVAVLNMASPLVPGGGFLNGATSQEEFLCLRSTLLPSLKDEFYRLPELGALYTPDVLVFRDGAGKDLAKKDRVWMDVVTAAMLRFPETEAPSQNHGQETLADKVEAESGSDDEEGQQKVLPGASYTEQKDRDLVVAKMKVVMRILSAKGVKRVVLGAWGCGAYGNPVSEIARAWKRVLVDGDSKNRKDRRDGNANPAPWNNIREIVFAITQPRMASEFHRCFGEGMEIINTEHEDGKDQISKELSPEADKFKAKIDELEGQIQQAGSSQLKQGLQAVLEGLRKQLEAT